MKITYTHHRNSQLHVVPVQPGHVISCICPCNPTLKMKNGHIMVDHKSGRGFKGKWRGEVKNYGTKLLDERGNPR
jgi:hypothetical protein